MANRVAQFYNLDAPVGKGKPNLPDDVLLVRYFLSQIKGSAAGSLISFDPPGDLPVIPMWDQQLTDWIIAFQSSPMVQHVVDGIVDPARGTAFQKSTITHEYYTIVMLNNAYYSNQPESHAALWLDTRVPESLRQSLLYNIR